MARSLLQFARGFFYSEGVTPLPYKEMSILFTLMLFHAMKLTMVFSFLPKMVKSFGVSEVNTGYYAGLLASSIYVGFVLFSLLWGYLGDVKSKKLSMVISTIGLAVSSLAFGFSYNYTWAVVTRLLQGCFFGVAHVGKSVLCDYLDDSNMALGMSILMSAWTTGFILGPSIAGFLVFPAEQYPNTFSKNSILGRFPVLLPHLLTVSGLIISLLLTILYFPTTRKHDSEETPLLSERTKVPTDDAVNSKNLQHEGEVNDDVGVEFRNTRRRTFSEYAVADALESSVSWIREPTTFKDVKLMKILRNKTCILACATYAFYGFAGIGYEELFPLYASTSKKYNGMGFTTSDIGLVLMIASICILMFQISMLTKVVNYIGARKTFIWCAILQVFLFPVIPATAFIKDKTYLWLALCCSMVMLRMIMFGCYLSVNILINNSVEPDMNASLNGISFGVTSLFRLFAPAAFGSLFSWSLTNIKDVSENTHPLGFPFNQFFVFLILSILIICIGVMAMKIPGSLDFKYVIATQGETKVNLERRSTSTL